MPLHEKRGNRKIYLFFPAAVFFMELVVKVYCFDKVFDRGLLYTLLFSFSFGLIAAVLSSISQRACRIVSLCLLFLLTLIPAVQIVYYKIFDTFLTLFSMTGAGEAIGEFWSVALDGIFHSVVPLLLLFIPFILLCVFGRRWTPSRRLPAKTLAAAVLGAAALQLGGIALINISDDGIMSDAAVYAGSFSPVLSVPRFGVLTTFRLDVQNLLEEDAPGTDAGVLPSVDSAANASNGGAAPVSQKPAEPVSGENILPVDFNKLIAGEKDPALLAMHQYFSTVEPTSKNKYTGMFKGYNLIWIVAEGFSSLALDAGHTPTLTKLAGEGFVFDNFYNPVWGVSTSDGEYVATTGLLPKSGVWSYYRSASNDMPFGFGNMFNALGYVSRAYHDNTYTYYNRDKSYPNMGYIYKGVGNGLQLTKQWPQSDVEMMAASLPDYIHEDHFLTYYMTVSGHMNYTFTGNMMAYRHKSAVSDLPYTEPARAYIACQMEFDQAVRLLIDELQKAGVLDKTVIVISGDHYPYGLEVSQMEEIKGGKIETNFELYRSTLMIWNSQMGTVRVGKYCSSLDIMPTLCNLFALPYDSRLVMGRDILSDGKPLVIFGNRSFITDLGRYNSKTDTFTANKGAQIPEHYARDMVKVVSNKFKYAAAILDHDYYGVLFGKT